MNMQPGFNNGINNGDYGYGYNNPYSGNPVPSRFASPVQPQMQPQLRTNVLPVTSLQEALSKNCELNSEIYFRDQSKPVFYVIRTNDRGYKEWAEIPYSISNSPDNSPATRADVAAIVERLVMLERIVSGMAGKPTSNPEVKDEESDR